MFYSIVVWWFFRVILLNDMRKGKVVIWIKVNEENCVLVGFINLL